VQRELFHILSIRREPQKVPEMRMTVNFGFDFAYEGGNLQGLKPAYLLGVFAARLKSGPDS
jgi:hypothetical protein